MASSAPPSKSEASDCQEIDPENTPGVCGAATVAHRRCLAHLTPEQLTAYLATLSPGSDINARGVMFSGDLLEKLLSRFRSGVNATVGAADFSGAVFTDSVLFFRMFFRERVNFSNATFAAYAHFFRTGFREDADFSSTSSAGVPDSAARRSSVLTSAMPGSMVPPGSFAGSKNWYWPGRRSRRN